MALSAAASWVARNPAFANGITSGDAVAERDAAGKLLWWTVVLSSGGAVIVAPDTRVEPVLAALPRYDGELPAGHPLRALLTRDIAARLAGAVQTAATTSVRRTLRGVASTSAATETLSPAAAAAQANWSRLGVVSTGLRGAYRDTIPGDEAPNYILGLCPGFEYGGVYTHWNQSDAFGFPYVYNYYTPLHAVCGCVATAGSAVLQYFNVLAPVAKYQGDHASVSWGNPMSPTAHFFDQTLKGADTNIYDWASLPVSLGGTNETDIVSEADVELLGRVAYDVGTCVGMGYDMGGGGTSSGAVTAYLAPMFTEVYGFGDARALCPVAPNATNEYEHKNGYYDYNVKFTNTNERLLYDHLRCNVPVGMGISTEGSDGGHAVLAVGYGRDVFGTSYTRVFMGWAGNSDAWYCLPNISDYNVVHTLISFIAGPGETASVPFVGRVTTDEKDGYGNPVGAAFQKVELLNGAGETVATATTDAHGYWSVRVDGSGWSDELQGSVASEVTEDDQPLPDDAKELRSLMARVAASPSTNVIDATTLYVETVFLATNDMEEVTYSVRATNWVYAAQAKAVCRGVSVEKPFSPLVFCSDLETLPDMVCASLDVTIPATEAVCAYSSPMDVEAVAEIAAKAGKKLLVVNGDTEDAGVQALKAYVAANPDTFNAEYVIYNVIPGMDLQGWDDGAGLTYGIFDPNQVTAEGRWSLSNGRLVYRSCANVGFEEETFAADLETAGAAFAKRYASGDLVVSACAEDVEQILGEDVSVTWRVLTAAGNGLWGGVTGPAATNILGESVTGYATYSHCFTNGSAVTFSVPAVVTNLEEGAVLECVGWEYHALDPQWIASVDCTNLCTYLESVSLGVVASNGTDDVNMATVEAGAFGGLVWRWKLVEVLVRDASDGGWAVVTTEGGAPVKGDAWVPVGSTNTVTFVSEVEGADLNDLRCSYAQTAASLVEETEDPVGFTILAYQPRLTVAAQYAAVVEDARFSFGVQAKLDGVALENPPVELGYPVAGSPDYDTAEEFAYYVGGSYDGYYAPVADVVPSCRYVFAVDRFATNITDGVTNVYVCTGWEGTGAVPLAGTSNVVAFTLNKDSSIVWLWETWHDDGPDPLPEGYVMKGPGGASPLVFSPTGASAEIVNTIKGWWYGLYSTTSLMSPVWTLEPGQACQCTATDETIVLEAVVDPAEPTKFFKLMVTLEDPR